MKRLLILFITLVMTSSVIFPLLDNLTVPVHAAVPEYENTYENTGNQRLDIVGVAMTQLGYEETVTGYTKNGTKYGTWAMYPNQPWCANFVTWCARQAQIGTDVIKSSAIASAAAMGISYRYGYSYTPRVGDIFYTRDFGHTGIVWKVEGDYFHTIEGNGSPDFSYDGYWVVSNKRRIASHIFGIPKYKGDGDHNYIYHTEEAHPHKRYYKCTDCGDKYYTSFTDIVDNCSLCYSCGCTTESAGYYRVKTTYANLSIRSTHSTSGTRVAMVENGDVLYVYGMHGDWALVEHDTVRGHIQKKYLSAYYPPPTTPQIFMDQTDYALGNSVSISIGLVQNAEDYRMEIYRNGELIQDFLTDGTVHTLNAPPVGQYDVVVTAANLSGWSKPASQQFYVRNQYTVSFDPGKDVEAPPPQTQTINESASAPDLDHTVDGYTFVGWSESPDSMLVQYLPGDPIHALEDITVYAVWRDSSAVSDSIQIIQPPVRKMYLIGDELDTTGIKLTLSYSDGTCVPLPTGYTTSGFDSDELGVKTVTITYEGLTAQFEVEVADYIPGDFNTDFLINRDDVMTLLWHITFSEHFPISIPADYTGDGIVDRDDVMHLLWHITFPDSFPL